MAKRKRNFFFPKVYGYVKTDNSLVNAITDYYQNS